MNRRLPSTRRLLRLTVGMATALASAGAGFGRPAEPVVVDWSEIRVGHWVEVRGRWVESTRFEASRLDLIEPRSAPRLWGVAEQGEVPGTLAVLGQTLVFDEGSKMSQPMAELVGRRVRVQGSFGAQRQFHVRSIAARSPGRDRILGRVGSVRSRDANGLRLTIQGFEVHVAPNAEMRSEGPSFDLARTAPTQLASSYSWIEDIDDLLGDGFQLHRDVSLRLRQDLSTTSRRNFELDDPDDRDVDLDDDLDDSAHSLRLQLTWTPNSRATFAIDGRHRWRHRDVRGATDDDSDLRLNEAWLLVRDIGWGVDMQIGRTDHDDPREWLYDQNLDGVRLFKTTQRLRWELGLSTTLSDGSSFDRSATNAVLYIVNKSGPRHLAGYVVHRSFGGGRQLERSHVGARLLGPLHRRVRVWSEASMMLGRADQRDLRAWALDLGGTVALDARGHTQLSAGFAKASGDRRGPSSTTDTSTEFRQTGLHDNDARLGGLAAVRYYGELLDPELSNLEITTLGVSHEVVDDVSVELIGHTYRQSTSTDRLRSDVDQRPSGLDVDLGWELDLVLAFRRFRRWDVEMVGAHFHPGRAFPDAESARLVRFQIRYRY